MGSLSFLNFLESFLNEWGIDCHLSKVEIAFDFYTDNPRLVKYLLCYSAYLKHCESVEYYKEGDFDGSLKTGIDAFLFNLYTTFYLNNTRDNNKAVRIYFKEEFDRCELQLNYDKLQYYKISTITDFLKADVSFLISDLEFVDINWEAFYNYCSWENRHRYKRNPRLWLVGKRRLELELRRYAYLGVQALLLSQRGRLIYPNHNSRCDEANREWIMDMSGDRHRLITACNGPVVKERNAIDHFIRQAVSGRRITDILKP
ncbi:MAG: hypothetical protein HOC71_11455 [Candidatus Latescibacteria bacterium]|nr:hypothetical protein [Candidatus Latescibacterota bacterium]